MGLHEILRESRTSDLGFGGPGIGSTTAQADDQGDGINCHHLFPIGSTVEIKVSTLVSVHPLPLFLGAVASDRRETVVTA